LGVERLFRAARDMLGDMRRSPLLGGYQRSAAHMHHLTRLGFRAFVKLLDDVRLVCQLRQSAYTTHVTHTHN